MKIMKKIEMKWKYNDNERNENMKKEKMKEIMIMKKWENERRKWNEMIY